MTDNYLYEKARIIYQKYKDCKELQRSITIKTVMSLVFTVAWYYIWTSSAISYFNKPWATFNPKNVIMYITIIVIVIAPFYLFKPQKMLNTKPFLGKLCDKKFTYLHLTRHSTKTYFVVTVKSLDGKKVKRFKMKAVEGLLNRYTVDTAVVKLRGLDYPIIIDEFFADKSPDDTIMCPHCGHFNPARYERCFECSSPVWVNK